MNYIHARLFKRSLLVLSVKVAFTLLLPWIRRHDSFYRFTRILCSCTLLPSYAKTAHTFTLPPPYVYSSHSLILSYSHRLFLTVPLGIFIHERRLFSFDSVARLLTKRGVLARFACAPTFCLSRAACLPELDVSARPFVSAAR